MILRNSCLPSACRSHEAKQNPRSSHTPSTPKTYQYRHAAEIDFFQKEVLFPPIYDLPINTSAKDGSEQRAGVQAAVESQEHSLLLSRVFPVCEPSHSELTACGSPKIAHAASFLLPFLNAVLSARDVLSFQELRKTCFLDTQPRSLGSRTFSA